MADSWVLYWLACERGKTYVGITNNLAQRFRQHQAGLGGKFTRAFRPTDILAVQPFPDRGSATRAERLLKAKSLAAKQAWARDWPYPPA
ncbi:GIY-YIG nuclease family protein [Ectothiorhodospiraceae bacterium 2226]|nr:GIY-YIG nuclease family protein [Ectothiorhodospiraceae bacterium 2226]